MKGFLSKHKVLLIFSIFFLLVLFQHHFMWLYHDDYGYASLSYVGDIYKTHYAGYHTSIVDICRFLGYHYNNWGGRILYFFIECFLLRFGMHGFRIFQSVMITLLFYFIYKIISAITKKEDYRLAVFTCLLYGVFEIILFRGSVFWITASVLYIYPLVPFLAFIYFYVIKKKNNKIINTILLGLLVFLAAFSQEQISAMLVSFLCLYIGYKYFKTKKISIKDTIMLILSLIGFGLLMLAPGSKVRMNHPSSADFYDLSLLGKIKRTLPEILFGNFGGYTRIFTIIFFACICYIAYKNLSSKNKKIFDNLNVLSILSNLIILIFTLYKHDGYFNYFYNYSESHIIKLLCMGVYAIQLLLIVYSVCLYFFNKKQPVIVGLFLSSLVTQAVMLVAPYFPLRSAMIMQFIMFIIIGYCFVEIFNKLNKKIWVLIIPLSCILLFNYCDITIGYIRNNAVNSKNHNHLIKASKDIKNGKDIKVVKLEKLPDITYSCDQPYIEGFDYITTYMKVYYQIPLDVKIEYK